MEINKQPVEASELRALLKAKEKYYSEGIKNNMSFEKLRTIEQSIKELKSILSKRGKSKKS